MFNKDSRIICLAPHADDEVLGCGCLLAHAHDVGALCHVLTVAAGSYHSYALDRMTTPEERMEELSNALEVVNPECTYELFCHDEGRLDTTPMVNLVTKIDKLLQVGEYDTVLYCAPSHHQDHQFVYNASVAALRPNPYTKVKTKLVYEYTYQDAWNPNAIRGGKVYLDATDLIDRKMKALDQYVSQMNRDTRDLLHPSAVKALAKMRGVECGCDYAEAYYLQTHLITP